MEHGLLIIVDAHLTIVLVVLLVLEERDPLVVRVQTAVQHDELGDGDAADVLGQTSSFADESDAIGGHLCREGHRRCGFLLRAHVLCIEGAVSELQLHSDVLLRYIGLLWFQLQAKYRDLDVILLLYNRKCDLVFSYGKHLLAYEDDI